MVAEPLTRLMCSPIGDGAAAIIEDGAGPNFNSVLANPGHVPDSAKPKITAFL